MGTNSVQPGQNSGQVPGFQDGGAKTQQELDTMETGQLMDLAKTGNDIDKKNAVAELGERLGTAGGDEQKGKDGGGTKDGGGLAETDELKKLLEKLLKGTITPEEEEKLRQATGGANPSAKTPDQNDPEKIGSTAPTSPIEV